MKMKTYTIIVSRYQSVAVNVKASSLEKAEELALEASEDDFFYDHDDVVEVVDSWEEDDENEIINISEEE